jgi:hypothetical protein
VSTDQTYTMTVDLSVVESLGINLYSNAAAVLSELVANAYDADSTKVRIEFADGRIVVADDGAGMDVDALNERFLKVGYKKRAEEGADSPKFGRPFMGRKGIGKLSVFSIADIVTVYSVKDGTANGLRIVLAELLASIEARQDYHPEPVNVPGEYATVGTTLVLAELKKKRADLTARALRKRLARRFDVLDEKPAGEGGFSIEVDNKAISYEDRQELKKLEFLWEFGEATLPDTALSEKVTRFVIHDDVVNDLEGWRIRGWFGTTKLPTDLTVDEEAGSLRNIIVLARKRPIQEGIIEKLDFSRIFGSYVTGQIEADFLDLDERDDIATSDRQRLIEDDPRVEGLQRVLREAFKKASDTWTDLRPKKEAKDVLARHPKLRLWVESRPGWQREPAEALLGTIAALPLEEKNEQRDRAALFRSGILAFERVALRTLTDELQELSTIDAAKLLVLLGAQDAYEAGMWVDILRSRVSAISQFQGLTEGNEMEKVLQQHLFDHLWLIDPAWERATEDKQMEQDLRRVEPGLFATNEVGEQITGRLDIRYMTMGGVHVIVELKRYALTIDIDELVDQGLKYYTAMKSLLAQQGKGADRVEVIFVVGQPPTAKKAGAKEDQYVIDKLGTCNGRVVLYDEMIANAKNQYREYLEASDKARELDDLLSTFDDGLNL